MVNTYTQPAIEQQPAPRMSMTQTQQPIAMTGMNHATQPTTEQAVDQQAEVEGMRLRGGGEACPGRFCFIIPCPIPCNFCVFPLPC
ncbi:hypothetical protein NliqN6_0945 [Naganishia liquefaciens]|uniref:Uncharacterized protein n=1 Tax=Naganishia liquefaciens TaxID=104408 RepID=A0A8H3TPH0_9TREE|nr:hypothetical protein NliqN6_0945 [Naganishia liquefaciens]